MKTYEIIAEMLKLDAMSNEIDEETGEFKYSSDELHDMFNKLSGTIEDKLNAFQHVIKQKKAEIEINKEEMEQIKAVNKSLDKDIISLNDTMGFLLNGENVKTNKGSFYYGKESLYIANESQFKQDNPEYIKERPSVSKYLDKKEILKDVDKLKGAIVRKGVIFRAKKVKE